MSRLKEIGGGWKVNGEAIYNTRTVAHYHLGDTWFTQDKDGKVYAISLVNDGKVFRHITWPEVELSSGVAIHLLGAKKHDALVLVIERNKNKML